MQERLVCISGLIADPLDAGVLSTGAQAITIPFNCTIVSFSAAPSTDDAGLTVDIQITGTDVITAVACAVALVPGTWKSTHVGGTNDPIAYTADTVIEFDINSAAAATALSYQLWVLV